MDNIEKGQLTAPFTENMQHIASYFKEREDFDCLVTEEGFAAYKIFGDECYIRDIFIQADYRKRGFAAVLADTIAHIAKRKGCKYLTGSVSTLAKDPTTSTKVLIAYGFHIVKAVPDGIWFRKDI